MLLRQWRSLTHISSLLKQSEGYLSNFPAVAKRVDEEVDTAIDSEEEMTNQEELGTDGNFLQSKRKVEFSVYS